ncbi:MAG: xanthine dehydrogenase family protein subunit M [Dehalococcoidia bacterium]|jgi:carbon-monoxide dehydrogenase medium subunit|nr:carbon monoxide dehydrogenase [Chloroflexota bacterium]MDP6056919.1 xanthine dehydrogenase family protein subunit M [Dehalococcoidia bacterium]MDP7262660.1 xanthine dehydrogenase family protein subunit M [Dehalococcoidia bacterium]MDP7484967.1 xanthine dehydrogenase family protein subunit M [Dehalococcoidia bacterium]|tara:strand:+ start:874 stop:1737 length:864 start_codon:yes stop_codon:yes gene_type:complete
MPNFDYEAPTSLASALELLARPGEISPMAGGTDVIDQLKNNRRNADLVVDLKRIPDLLVLESNGSGLRIGSAVSCTEVHNFTAENGNYSALAESSELVGSVHIQNRASIGGNVCNAAPSADTIPSLLIHEAVAHTASASGEREIPLIDFFAGPGQTVLQKGEILKELGVPTPSANTTSAYLRFIPRNEMDIAVAGVGSLIEVDPSSDVVTKARIALASVAPTPVRAYAAEEFLEGKNIDVEVIAKTADLAVEATVPITDVRGSAEYRKELIKVLTKRTLNICLERLA